MLNGSTWNLALYVRPLSIFETFLFIWDLCLYLRHDLYIWDICLCLRPLSIFETFLYIWDLSLCLRPFSLFESFLFETFSGGCSLAQSVRARTLNLFNRMYWSSVFESKPELSVRKLHIVYEGPIKLGLCQIMQAAISPFPQGVQVVI